MKAINEFKGTRGEWVMLPEEVDKPYIRIRGTVLGGRYKVANVLTPVYDNVHPREAEETRANARLIAAAPELLEALQEMVDIVKKNSYPQPDKPSSNWGKAEAAQEIINKVLGANNESK